MKSVFVAMAITIAGVSLAFADEFCNGFERGFSTGFKQASGSSLEPLTPLCPLQPLKRLNDPDSDFEHGYILGLQRGYEEGRG